MPRFKNALSADSTSRTICFGARVEHGDDVDSLNLVPVRGDRGGLDIPQPQSGPLGFRHPVSRQFRKTEARSSFHDRPKVFAIGSRTHASEARGTLRTAGRRHAARRAPAPRLRPPQRGSRRAMHGRGSDRVARAPAISSRAGLGPAAGAEALDRESRPARCRTTMAWRNCIGCVRADARPGSRGSRPANESPAPVGSSGCSSGNAGREEAVVAVRRCAPCSPFLMTTASRPASSSLRAARGSWPRRPAACASSSLRSTTSTRRSTSSRRSGLRRDPVVHRVDDDQARAARSGRAPRAGARGRCWRGTRTARVRCSRRQLRVERREDVELGRQRAARGRGRRCTRRASGRCGPCTVDRPVEVDPAACAAARGARAGKSSPTTATTWTRAKWRADSEKYDAEPPSASRTEPCGVRIESSATEPTTRTPMLTLRLPPSAPGPRPRAGRVRCAPPAATPRTSSSRACDRSRRRRPRGARDRSGGRLRRVSTRYVGRRCGSRAPRPRPAPARGSGAAPRSSARSSGATQAAAARRAAGSAGGRARARPRSAAGSADARVRVLHVVRRVLVVLRLRQVEVEVEVRRASSA